MWQWMMVTCEQFKKDMHCVSDAAWEERPQGKQSKWHGLQAGRFGWD